MSGHHPGQYPGGQNPGGQNPSEYPGGQNPGQYPQYPGGQYSGGQPPYPQPTPPSPPPAQQPLPSFPHPEPREYPQMLRTWNYAWWKPVVGTLIVAAGMIVIAPLVLLPVLMAGVAIEGGPFWENFQKAASLQAVGPSSLLYLNLTLGSTVLVCWFVMRVIHRMRPRWLSSVMPKMRWKFFFICLGLAVLALLAQIVVSVLLPGAQEGDVTQKVNDFTATTVSLGLVVLFTTPLQAAGEEYVFRGYLMQAFGSLFNNKWVALVITATLFALAHGVQNFPLFFDRFAFGFIAGWLVIKTGGLEAGIALHILNNFLAFGFALVFSDLTDTLNVSEVGWVNIPLTLTQSITYVLLVLYVAKKMGLRNHTTPPAHRQPSHDVNVLTHG